ncbi:MAG: hypothetical protein JWP36_789 [Paucimonas sp.]|nr:hypothetical protein [Paucimonas sp.]
MSRTSAATNLEGYALTDRFNGVYGVVLRVDATTPKSGVTISSDSGGKLSLPGGLRLEQVDATPYTDRYLPVPESLHVTWRDGNYKLSREEAWIGGRVAGKYTVPVAERIPDALLEFIRQNGGALRIKVRLQDNGVLIAWDVEQWYASNTGRRLQWVRPGGDFIDPEAAGAALLQAVGSK